MKKDEVKVMGVYAVKVSGRIQPVRITKARGDRTVLRRGPYATGDIIHSHRNDGWDATNLATGRSIRIVSAAKLRYELVPLEGQPGKWRRAGPPKAPAAHHPRDLASLRAEVEHYTPSQRQYETAVINAARDLGGTANNWREALAFLKTCAAETSEEEVMEEVGGHIDAVFQRPG